MLNQATWMMHPCTEVRNHCAETRNHGTAMKDHCSQTRKASAETPVLIAGGFRFATDRGRRRSRRAHEDCRCSVRSVPAWFPIASPSVQVVPAF